MSIENLINSKDIEKEQLISDESTLSPFKDRVLSPRKIKENKKRFSYQIRIFILTYFSYAVLHFTRESWSILKPKI